MVVTLLAFSANSAASESFQFKQEDIDFAKDLRKGSIKMNMPAIKEKWYELQYMLGTNSGGDNGYDIQELDSNISLKIFVSNSMGKNLLKSYAMVSKKYAATLVFQGLPGGSWCKLSDLVYEISQGDDENIAMQIDDEAFNQFSVRSVPAIVLVKEENTLSENPKVTFDKVTGSIGIKRALELFSSKGELAEIALDRLRESEAADE